MPWFGWYSTKEEKIYGYAHYLNKRGETVAITKITRDPNYTHPYKDAIYIGKLTYFCGVQKWNAIKAKMKEAKDRVMSVMEYNTEGLVGEPCKIVN